MLPQQTAPSIEQWSHTENKYSRQEPCATQHDFM